MFNSWPGAAAGPGTFRAGGAMSVRQAGASRARLLIRALFAAPTPLWSLALLAALATLALASALASALAAAAELPSDLGQGVPVARLATPPSPHWVWVNDLDFPYMVDGRAHLVDGDTGRYLGALSTGFSFSRLVLARDGRLIYSPETYFSRGTRGIRTDVVTVYDAATLEAVGEIGIPPKRSSNVPKLGNAALTDDDRFLLVYNFNPGQSVTVVDMMRRTFAAEVGTPGCALVYPTGPRSFFSVCGDGSLLLVELDENGTAAHQERTQPLIDMSRDPVTETAVRRGNTWYFVTMDGQVLPVQAEARAASAGAGWSLTSAAERLDGWRPGGVQQVALHAGKNQLYAIMHQGSRDTHKDPGKEIWVYDLSAQRRVGRIALRAPATSIQLSTDARPLLFSAFADGSDLDVYDPVSGQLLRTVEHVGTTPMVLLTP
jgi:methylamine dehydrogenase heavy chain